MKKRLIIFGSILIMAFVVVLFVNATGSKKESRKAKTEVATGKNAGSGSASCCQPAADKAAASVPACGQSASCAAACGAKTKAKK